MRRLRRRLLCSPDRLARVAVALALVLSLALPANATEDPAEGVGLDEILITAERRESTLQQTPVAVSAYSGLQLDAAGHYDFEDLSGDIPNVQFGRNLVDSGGVTIRGISSSSGDRATAFHLDGVYVNFGSAAEGLTFFDVRRVEVLRGPQGTLYGRNATGGSINVISNPPVPGFDAFGDVQFGNYDQTLLRAGFNLPLVGDELLLRTALLSHRRNGYQQNIVNPDRDNDADDADQLALRTQLRWIASDHLDFTLRHVYTKARGVGPAQKVRKPFPEAVELVAGLPPVDLYCQSATPPPGCSITPNPGDPRDIALDRIGIVDNHDHRLNGEVAWDLPELPVVGETRAKLLVSWFQGSRFNQSDQDGSDGDIVTVFTPADTPFVRDFNDPGNPSAYVLTPSSGCDPSAFAGGASSTDAGCTFGSNALTEWVAEAQWASAGDGDLQWLLGLFFLDTESENDTFAATFPTPALRVPVLSVIDDEARSYAVFGQADYRLGRDSATRLDDFTLTLGLRFSRDEKATRRQTPQVLVGPFTLQALIDATPDTPGGASGISDEWNAISGTARAQWLFSEQSNLYFSIGRGYKSGFLNNALLDAADPTTLVPTADPEYLWAFELGSKNRFFEDRLQANLTGFVYLYDDLQVSQLVGLSLATQNASSAKVYGLEVELAAQPFDGFVAFLEALRLRFNLGLLHAEFDTFENCALPEGAGTIDCSGNRLTRAPPYTVALIADWPIDLGELGTLRPYVEFRATGKVYFRPSNCPNAECLALIGDSLRVNEDFQAAYQQLDLRLTWTVEDGRLSISAFVDNVTDQDVIQSQVTGSNAIGSPIQVRYDAPRTAGVRVGMRW